MAADQEPKKEYKIILIGDPAVGKTSYFLRIRDDNFVETEELRTTIMSGVDCLNYPMKVDNSDILVKLHDTGGGERFRTLTSNFYRNADAAILMYSVEDRFTFENLQEWYENACEVIPDMEQFVWALVGNKCDLPLEVENENIDIKCKSIGTTLKFFTSAKTGELVKESFEEVIKEVHRRSVSKMANPDTLQLSSGVKITTSKKSKCC